VSFTQKGAKMAQSLLMAIDDRRAALPILLRFGAQS
jgi:hypothetical protein